MSWLLGLAVLFSPRHTGALRSICNGLMKKTGVMQMRQLITINLYIQRIRTFVLTNSSTSYTWQGITPTPQYAPTFLPSSSSLLFNISMTQTPSHASVCICVSCVCDKPSNNPNQAK